MQNNVIAITGFHRSGTSLLAKWLYHCNLFLGNELMQGNYSNPSGHYEDLEFLNLQDSILRNCQIPTYATKALTIIPTGHELLAAKKLITQRNSQRKYWAWKDPRTSLLLNPLWHQLIPDLKLIIIYRNFNDAVSSLYVRELLRYKQVTNIGLRKRISYLLKRFHHNFFQSKIYNQFLSSWILYHNEIINFIKIKTDSEVVVLDIDTILKIEENIITHLNEFWGLALSFYPIKSLINPKKYQNYPLIEFNSQLEYEAIQIYNQLKILRDHSIEKINS